MYLSIDSRAMSYSWCHEMVSLVYSLLMNTFFLFLSTHVGKGTVFRKHMVSKNKKIFGKKNFPLYEILLLFYLKVYNVIFIKFISWFHMQYSCDALGKYMKFKEFSKIFQRFSKDFFVNRQELREGTHKKKVFFLVVGPLRGGGV